jgi:hypothetical protein
MTRTRFGADSTLTRPRVSIASMARSLVDDLAVGESAARLLMG